MASTVGSDASPSPPTSSARTPAANRAAISFPLLKAITKFSPAAAPATGANTAVRTTEPVAATAAAERRSTVVQKRSAVRAASERRRSAALHARCPVRAATGKGATAMRSRISGAFWMRSCAARAGRNAVPTAQAVTKNESFHRQRHCGRRGMRAYGSDRPSGGAPADVRREVRTGERPPRVPATTLLGAPLSRVALANGIGWRRNRSPREWSSRLASSATMLFDWADAN